MEKFFLTFLPLFIAVDAIGILPIFISSTENIEEKKIKWIILQSVITAMIVSLTFSLIGTSFIKILGIKISNFMIAGGLLLFIISLNDILSIEKKMRIVDIDSIGAMPIGVPLIAGPAVLTTTILLIQQFGIIFTIISIVLNILLAGIIFLISKPVYKFLGKAGSKTVSKLASILLAAIAVMLIRKGIFLILSEKISTN